MPGILGIYPFGLGRENWRLARFVYYGLLALQHRGQEIASIITFDKELHNVTKKGFVDEAFDEKTINSIPGFIGVGFVSPTEEQTPIEVSNPLGLILVGDGKPELEEDVRESWRAFAELLAEEIDRTKNALRAALNIIEKVNGGYSFIALTENQELIAGRDVHGVKPLEVGSLGFDLGAVASESSALDVLGMEHIACVKPGEVVKFDPYSIERGRVKGADKVEPKYCSFEYVYLARPDSIINDIPIYKVRESIGVMLAKEHPVKADIVIGIPETAIPFALGYSKSSGIPVSLGFVTTGRKVRTAIKPSIFERLVGVQLKLNPIKCVIDGKDIVLIDDSVVRGTTLRNTVWNLKRKGARRVHVRIGSPSLVSSCPYGIEIPPPDELIARALDEREIAEVIGADTFSFLSIESLCKAIGLPCNRLCLSCWRRRT
ncbi:MAG: amidophosphoribosyltransferase [Thermoprotei archaeon]|nr:MAG: amidophosphoribosyltransferase [Thermoprotei archaeon]RLF20452.1 MAG: amidophosphoribosyltransferase [Thermoprotei archaeon]